MFNSRYIAFDSNLISSLLMLMMFTFVIHKYVLIPYSTCEPIVIFKFLFIEISQSPYFCITNPTNTRGRLTWLSNPFFEIKYCLNKKMNPCVSGASTNIKRTSNKTSISMGKNQSANNPKKFPIDEENVTQMQNQKAVVFHTIDLISVIFSCTPTCFH